jgi:hypothetical protein
MKNKSTGKKVLAIVIFIIILLIIQTLPVFFLKPIGSKTIIDSNICLYYQPGDEKGANEIFDILKEKADEIRSKMNFKSDVPTKVYLYKSQKQLAIREAGFITLTFAPSWYIGDSHNGNIMMVSPYTHVKGHTHDTIVNATLHELVHSTVYQINPKLSYFWDNGLATYLAQQKPEEKELNSRSVPSLDDMHTENGLKFGEMGGYAFSYNYIEYLNKTYGWGKVVAYDSGKGNYEEIFSKSEEDIYKDWCKSISLVAKQ